MKKRVLKLAKGLNKFNIDDIQLMSEIEEPELRQILDELAYQGSVQKISDDNFMYVPSAPNAVKIDKKAKSSDNIPLNINPENIKGYDAYLKSTGKQREYADKYFKMIQACGNLKGSKLMDFIDNKWNKMFPEYKSSYACFMNIKKKFNQNGFYALLPEWTHNNKGSSCIFDELYSIFIDEYFSFESPPLTEAARIAKKKFVEKNPDFEICQLPPEGTFAKRIKKEYSQEEISIFRSFAIKNKLKKTENIKQRAIKEPTEMLFKIAAEEFLKRTEKRHKKSTYVSNVGYIKNHLNPVLADFKLGNITQDMINKIRQSKLEEGFSISSVNSYVDAAEQIIREFIPNSNKLKKTEMHTENRANFYSDMRILASEEIKKLLKCCNEHYSDFYPLLLTAITTGITRGEILGLTWDCINFNHNQILINKSLYKGEIVKHRTKYQIRCIHMPDELSETLLEWQKVCPKGESNFVFPNSQGKAYDPDNMIKRRFNPVVKKTGIKEIRFIDLRDIYASLLIKQDLPLTFIQEQLGHSSPQVTADRYKFLIEKYQSKNPNILQGVL